MQKFYTVVCVVLLAMAQPCCSGRKNADPEVIKESPTDAAVVAEAYHELMAQSFHPFMDSGNLMPAKAHADELATAAAQWYGRVSIAEGDTTLASKLLQLKIHSRAFAEIVKNGNTDTIGRSLENLHHEFHGVMELWSKELEDRPSK